MKKKPNILLIIVIVMVGLIFEMFIYGSLLYLMTNDTKVKVNKDINKYNNYIGPTALNEYRNKWDMDESIFPMDITKVMNVNDYRMVYYNPWDAQYLSYLVVDYDDDAYKSEMIRLNNYKSTEYKDYYGVTGFSKYSLVAINADPYQGFVYALTDNKNRIIYVELIFCNYYYDLDYKKYINNDYLPDGFDATINNSYARKMSKMKNY